MAKLQNEIADTFLEKLGESADLTTEMVDQLRELFSSKKKLKPDDLVRVFAPPPGRDVK